MKKVLFTVLAAAALVACSKNEVVDLKQNPQITFDGAFIDAATRAAADPSTTTGSIADFDVWAFMDDTDGVVFVDEDVVKQGTAWTYQNTQYWSPNHTYYFAALSPMNSENWDLNTDNANTYGAGVVSFTNVDGSEDLIYAATSVKTPAAINAQPDPVKLQFNHLLSKVKFTFKNAFPNENTQLVVKDITMEVPSAGTIDLAQQDWWSTNQWVLAGNAQPLTLEFGDVARLAMAEADECAQERLTIPAEKTQEYKVTFTVELYQGEVLAQTFNETTTVNGVALEIGKAYNFTAELGAANLGLFPIEFEVVEVKDWVEDTDFQEEIVADAKTVTLVSDGAAEKTILVKNDGVLDGAGHTMTLDAADAADFMAGSVFRYIEVENGGTVKNLKVDGGNLTYGAANSGLRAIYVKSGDLTVDNFVTKDVRYALNMSGNGKLTVSNSTLQGWTSFAASEATFKNVNFTNGEYANFKPYGNVTLINCTFEKGFQIDMEELDGVITFVNCYYNDVLISADNYQDEEFIKYDMKYFDAAKVNFNTTVPSVAAGETYVMESDASVVTTVRVQGTLDGAGHTLSVPEVLGDNGIIRPEGNATIKNLTIDGENKSMDGKAVRAFYITKAGNYVIENVVTDNVAYAFNAQPSSSEGDITLTVINSTLEGWTSYNGKVTATFKNVYFKTGNFYETSTYSENDNGYFRPYGTTVLKDCNFDAGFVIDFSQIAKNGKSVEFENCYCNGVKITAETIVGMDDNNSYEDAAEYVTFK